MKITGFVFEDGSILEVNCFSEIKVKPKKDNTDYVLNVIKKYPEIRKNLLTHMTRKITLRERTHILDRLISSGIVSETKKGKAVYYKAS
jgi:hypothetical protein